MTIKLETPDGERVRLEERRRNIFKWSAFVLTFILYTFFHASRKSFSTVKKTIAQVWSPQDVNSTYYQYDQWNQNNMFPNPSSSSLFMGSLDTTFMISYSVGLFISGAIGDRVNLRKVLSYGMIGAGLSMIFFGCVSEWIQLYNPYWYVTFMSLNGLLQAAGWPAVVAIVGFWFGKSGRGFIMGLWGASPLVGNIMGSFSSSLLLHFGYQFSFLVPASLMIAGGVIVYFALISRPREAGMLEEDASDENCGKAINFFKAFLIPGVLAYSLCFTCLKFVNYSFFFWLPFYLQETYGWHEAQADFLSSFYDGGGIVGSIVCGLISDKLGVRAPVIALLLIGGCPSLLLYYYSPPVQSINVVLMFLTGFTVVGACILISTCIAADLGQKQGLSGQALATVTGIIDGFGSAGTAVGQLVIPFLRSRDGKGGWFMVFLLLIAMTFITLLIISGVVVRETKEFFQMRREKKKRRNAKQPMPLNDITTTVHL